MAAIPEEVVRRFAVKKEIDIAQAALLFGDLQRFLDDASSESLTPSPLVDEAWHEFILHTRFYIEFCQARYGKIIHHVPASPADCDSEESPTKRCGSGLGVVGANCSSKDACSSDCRSVADE